MTTPSTGRRRAASRAALALAALATGAAVLPVPAAHAQAKAGRNGAKFLDIGVGAREIALGSASTTLTGDANQVFWNPAGSVLADDQKISASFFYGDWFAGLQHSAAAVGYNLGAAGTVTLGVQTFGVSDIPANRQNGFQDPFLAALETDKNTGETYNYLDVGASLTYSRQITDRLALGATAKYIGETIDGVSANAVAFDFGSVYDMGMAGWKLGARLSHLGTDMSFYNQDNPLPLTFSIGTSFYPVNTNAARLMVTTDLSKPQDANQRVNVGGEASFYDLLFLRGGYKLNYSGQRDEGTSLRPRIENTLEGASLGGGVQYRVSGYDLALDYAYTQMELVDNTHRFTLRIRR